MIKLYENIKKFRIENGMNQSTLAEKVGYADKGMVSRIEHGKVDLSQSQIEKFAEVLNVSPATLMGWEDEPSDYLVNLASVYSPKNEISLDIEKHIDTTKALTAYAEILSYYKKLDETGKQDLLKYAKYLASNKESRKEE